MKTKGFKLIALLLTIILTNCAAFSQGKFELSGGFGFPDILNFKIKYGRNLQVGISQATYNATALEVYYHFAGTSQYTDQRTWDFMAGNIWNWQIESLGITDNSFDAYLYLRFGRTVNFSKKAGLNIGLGPCFEYSEFADIFNFSNFLPSANISIFLRL